MGLETPKERVSLQKAFESCRQDQEKVVQVVVAQDTFVDMGTHARVKLPAGETLRYLFGGVDDTFNYFVVRTSSGLEIQMPSSTAAAIQVELT